MDLKRSERFRLEAMLLSKAFNQPEPAFQPVKVTPVKPPPAGTADVTEPFFAPTQLASRPQNHPQQLSTDQPLTGPVSSQMASTSTVAPDHQSDSEMDTDLASDTESLPGANGHVEEGELSDVEQDLSLTVNDQALSEEQNYRETMRGIRSFMGWSHILDVDSALSSLKTIRLQLQSSSLLARSV